MTPDIPSIHQLPQLSVWNVSLALEGLCWKGSNNAGILYTALQELRISDINASVFTETHRKIIKSKTRTFKLKRTD